MPQATWRNKTFGVSDKQAEAAKDLGFSFSWNQDTKALDIIPVSFSVDLLASMGANIEQEIADYEALAGKTGVLKIGGKQMLPTMQLVGCDVKVNAQAPSGKILDATLSLSFEEYDPSKREKATASASSTSGATKTQTATLTQTATAAVTSTTTTTPKKTTTTATEVVYLTGEWFYTLSGKTYVKSEKIADDLKHVKWTKTGTSGAYITVEAKVAVNGRTHGYIDSAKAAKGAQILTLKRAVLSSETSKQETHKSAAGVTHGGGGGSF